jgi:predicted DNA-binding protein with PD1-like motif
MQFSEGNIGRIFVLRIDDGEDLIESVTEFVQKKDLKFVMGLFIGALSDGKVVTGPEFPVIPPVQLFETYESAWEVFGMVTIYPSADGPKLHIHSALGRGREALVGCLREKASVYLVNEIVLFEFVGLNAMRELDQRSGFFLLKLNK